MLLWMLPLVLGVFWEGTRWESWQSLRVALVVCAITHSNVEAFALTVSELRGRETRTNRCARFFFVRDPVWLRHFALMVFVTVAAVIYGWVERDIPALVLLPLLVCSGPVISLLLNLQPSDRCCQNYMGVCLIVIALIFLTPFLLLAAGVSACRNVHLTDFFHMLSILPHVVAVIIVCVLVRECDSNLPSLVVIWVHCLFVAVGLFDMVVSQRLQWRLGLIWPAVLLM